jgi:hypothetical protein
MLTEFRPTRRTVVALALGVVAFFVFFGESSSRTVNGVVVSEHTYNYAAVVLGAIAMLLVAGEAYRLFRGDRTAFAGPLGAHVVVFVAVAALGLYQVLAGADLV